MLLPMLDGTLLLPLAWMPSGGEWLVIALFGLLLFGKRLPEVGKSLGKGIVEFKKGLKGVEDEIDHSSSQPVEQPRIDQSAQAKASLPQGYKFDPYTGKPVEVVQEAAPGAGEPDKVKEKSA